MMGTELSCGAVQPMCPAPDISDPSSWIDLNETLTPQLLDMVIIGDRKGESHDVNEAGEYVGWAEDVDQDCRTRAAYWPNRGANVVDLHFVDDWQTGEPLLLSLDQSRATALRSDGQQIVGVEETRQRALLWETSGITWVISDLRVEIRDQTVGEWEFRVAEDINDEGWIVGRGIHENEQHAFLLVPLGSCPADLDGDGEINVFDLLEVLGAWGECPVGSICWSDLNGDTVVNVQDLLILLGAWGPCGVGGGEIPQTVQDCIDKIGLNDPIALEACIDAVSGGLPE
jgi:hypothetical protein